MSSVIDICNLALAHLGDSATISSIDPPEGSVQAEHCARFYPIARDALLERHPWRFATRRATLAALVADGYNWSQVYARPNGALRILSVIPSGAASFTETQPFECSTTEDGTPAIYTNLGDATVIYTASAPDTTRYSPLFVDALAWLLASYLAGPIIKGDSGAAMAKACFQTFRMVLSEATVSDANQQHNPPTHLPAWMAGR